MNSAFAQDTFKAAKDIWSDWSTTQDTPREHVVPFCTPIIPNPDVVIVGLNHARFDIKDDSAWGTSVLCREGFFKCAPHP